MTFNSRKTLLSAIGTGIMVLLVFATLFSAYGGYIDPRVLPAAAVAAMCFPGFITLSVLWLIGEVLARRREAFVLLGAILACLPAIFTYAPVNIHRPLSEEQSKRALTVMTYNTLWYDNYQNKGDTIVAPNVTLQAILDARPDIVCLQEAYVPWSEWRKGITSGQIDTLLAHYPYRVADRIPNAPVGLVVMSRYPVTRLVSEDIITQTGLYACYRISIHGRLLTLYNIHLQSIGLSGEDKALFRNLTSAPENVITRVDSVRTGLLHKLYAAFEQRAIQSDSLVAAASRRMGDIIIAGDYNDIPGCYAIRNLCRRAGMRDAFAEAGTGAAITYRADHFLFRIDHILFRGDMRCVDARRLAAGNSDHYPVMATFHLY